MVDRHWFPTSRRLHRSFHSTTNLFGKNRNGGRGRPKQKSTLSKRKPKADGSFVGDDDAETDVLREFNDTFATSYHAPVMPSECVDALLKQGVFADIIRDRKDRWRKKRNNIYAKRRKAGYHVNAAESCDFDGEVNRDEARTPRLFIDGTLGGGGHSFALLQQLNANDVLISCDVDPNALFTASQRLSEYLATTDYILDHKGGALDCGWNEDRPLFIPVQSNFRDLISVLSSLRHPRSGKLLLGKREPGAVVVDGEIEFQSGASGILLDLGVSSHQIDKAERGFAFMKEGNLDMRMSGENASSPSALTAADICNEFDETTISSILRQYGDEPRARRIAGAIVASRPLQSTTDLVHAINSVTPTFARHKRAGLIATSARVFQALRIVVNEEEGALNEVLEHVVPWALCRSSSHFLSDAAQNHAEEDGGVLVVLSYHSLEDGMTKRMLRDGHTSATKGRNSGALLEKDIYGNVIRDTADGDEVKRFEPLTKPMKASEEEVRSNSRARSAILRVGIRI